MLRARRIPALRLVIALMVVSFVALFSGCPQTAAEPAPTPTPSGAP